MNFTNFIPSTIKEWLFMILIFVLLLTLFAFYKALMKCKTVIQQYIDELRTVNKFIEWKQLYNEFEQFKNNRVSISSGDSDV